MGVIGAALLALAGAAAPPPTRSAERAITPELLRAHVRFLASDLLEGRGPATRGDRLAEEYVATQLEALGAKPAAPDGTWIQKVAVVGVTSHPGPLALAKEGRQPLVLKPREEFVVFSGVQEPAAAVENAEVVFVGYGIVAPEYRWDDYKGADLAGKVLLMMNNDPEEDPTLFEGKRRLYYGRWDYKYEQAARVGAVGAILIHTTPSASYPWQVVQSSWTGEQFSLPYEGGPRLQVKAWATEDACRRIAALGGKDLDALRAAAQKRDFRPVPLGVAATLKLQNEVQRKETGNVIGRLEGSDPLLAKEAVVYSAHHDHFGMREGKPGQDTIYNGALDNASGVADLLAIARAYARLPKMPKRSVLFVAFAAEEQGLLGSQFFARHLPVPAARLAVDINIDEANIWGRTRDIVVIGKGKSDLEATLSALAKADGRVVKDDQFPEKGTFYRSDQLNLAKVGVPAAYFKPGTDVIGKPPGWGAAQQEKFDSTDYHQPSDELKPDWDFEGMVEDARFYFRFGVEVANAARLPAWKPGDEFEAARKKALAKPDL
jgi:Zn-dependent M28 family amino/carboxypeptidase